MSFQKFYSLQLNGAKCAADMIAVAVAVLVGRLSPLCKKTWPDVTGLNSLKH